MKRIARIAIATAAFGAAALGLALATLGEAGAQKLDPRRPSVFVVGSPSGPMPMQRVDARRSGAAKVPLPSGPLQVVWRKTIGLSIDQPALAGEGGNVAIVTSRGDVVFLDGDGDESAHVSINGRSAGPAAMTSDGTIVFVTSTGDAIGVRRTSASPRFISRIGGERNMRAAPLALDDGGVVLSTLTDLVVLDAEGNVRARVTLPDGAAAPLLASGDKVLAITAAGTVYGWTPGREAVRLGSFGAPIDGGAALADATTLVAVIEGNHLVDLDLARGTRTSRSISSQGLFLGPAAVRAASAEPRRAAASPGPAGSSDAGAGGGPSAGGTYATLLSLTPSRLFVTTIDTSGQDVLRAPIALLVPPSLPDGGVAPLVAPPHTGVIIDPRGAVAWAATDGRVGIVTADGVVEPLSETLCTHSGRSSGVAGLTPVAPGAFIVTCEGGVVAKVTGPGGGSLRRPDKPRPSSTGGTGLPPPPIQPAPDDDDDEP